jgi:hypothetical protein
MIVALKTIHLLALAVALGGGVARLMLMAAARRSDTGAGPFALPQRWLAHLTTGGVAVLWLTGLALWGIVYRFADLGPAFVMKLAAATLLLILASYGWGRMMTGRPPAPPLAFSLVRGSVLTGVAAVLLAVSAFTG